MKIISLALSLGWEKQITHRHVTAVFPPEGIRVTTRPAGSDRFLLRKPREITGVYIQSIPGYALPEDLLIYLGENLSEVELCAIHLDHNRNLGTIYSIEIRELRRPLRNPRNGILKRLIEDDDHTNSFSR